MARSAHDSPRLGYLVALAMLVLAVLFPIGLMVFNPTLMFQRGWEQYVGTAIYLWAVVTLGRELWRLWRNEKAFEDAPGCSSTLVERSSEADRHREQGRARAKSQPSPRGSPATGEFSTCESASSSATSARCTRLRPPSSWRSTARLRGSIRSTWPAGSR